MAFVKSNGVTVSFARYDDVTAKDQRLFEQNEGLTEEVIYFQLKRATERLLTKIRDTDWWRGNFPSVQVEDVPEVNADKVLARKNDFTELCVALALADYILPKVADFSNEESSERQKMSYYTTRAEMMFDELIRYGDWYDFDGTGAITSADKTAGIINRKRIR